MEIYSGSQKASADREASWDTAAANDETTTSFPGFSTIRRIAVKTGALAVYQHLSAIYKPNTAFAEAIRKMDSDLINSFVPAPMSSETEYARCIELYERAKQSKKAPKFAIPGRQSPRRMAELVFRATRVGRSAYPELMATLAEICIDKGPIRIGCAANCPAVFATVLSLVKTLPDGAASRIKLDAVELNGRTFVSSLKCTGQYDLIITPMEAFLLAPDSSSLPYELIGPLFSETQRVYQRQRGGTPRVKQSMLVLANSSAHMQYLASDDLQRSDATLISNENDLIGSLDRMRTGDRMILWDPVSSLVERRPDDFVAIEDTEYRVTFGAFSAKPGLRSSSGWSPEDVDMFMIALLLVWRNYPDNRSELIQTLGGSPKYLSAFARSAGLPR